MELAINNGAVVFPGKIGHSNIGIKDGKIAAIKTSRIKAEQEINASGLIVFPGLVDCHVHFRDPGHPKKEDFFTGTKAACAGGVTTVIDMPNTSPPTSTIRALNDKINIAEKRAAVDFALHFAAKENEKELPKIQNSLKFYLSSSKELLITKQEAQALSQAANPSSVKCFHAEDDTLIQELTAKYKGKQNPWLHGKLRPPEAAVRAVEFIETLHGKKHICHVSTELELSKIKSATAETTPHYLFLTEKLLKEKGNYAKMNPPLRKDKDRMALWKALDSKIQCIATDHAPHTKEEKENDYPLAPSGAPGLETMLPLLLSKVDELISLDKIARLTSENPAKLFALKNKGSIAIGKDADFAIVDMRRKKKPLLQTKCSWNLFQDWKLPVVEKTISKGKLVWDGQFTGKKGSGKYLYSKPIKTGKDRLA